MKLPLAIADRYVCGVRIVDADALPIGNFSDEEWAEIVRRVNAHDILVAACQTARHDLEGWQIYYKKMDGGRDSITNATIAEIDAALALVPEEKQDD